MSIRKTTLFASFSVVLPRAEPDSADSADALAIAITHAHMRQAARLQQKLKQNGLGGRRLAGANS